MKKIIETIKKKWIRDTLATTIMILALFTIWIGMNIIIQKLDLQDIDVTKNQLFTISESSKNQVKNVEEEVKISLIGFSEDTALVDLAKQYSKINQNIQTELITDINQRADLKAKYNITDETQFIVIETQSTDKILAIDDLYTYDYTNYQQIDISEEKITNAIVDLTKQEKPKIYFLTGHMEQEVGLLTNYIQKGGKILWLSDPTLTGASFPNIQNILDQFGVTIDDGIILEQDETKMALQSPNYIIPNIATTNATKDIATDGGILLVNATKITLASDEKLEQLKVEAQNILTTSETALFRKDVSNTQNTKIASDEEGSFIIGCKLTKTINQVEETQNSETDKQAILYIISNNFFVADYPVNIGNTSIAPISFYNNKDYILNTIAELTENEHVISIRKDTGVIAYTATEAQDKLIRIAITIFPIVIIAIGIVVWWIRKNKR